MGSHPKGFAAILQQITFRDNTQREQTIRTISNLTISNLVSEHHNLNTWITLLQYTQPVTTLAFLVQKCHLLNFDDVEADIGVPSNLLKEANKKSASIEKSFEAAFGHSVRVNLRVIDKPLA